MLAMIMMMPSKVKAKEVKDARRDFVAPQFITIRRKRAGHHDKVDDIYIMMKCLSVTKNHHFLLGVSCNHLSHP